MTHSLPGDRAEPADRPAPGTGEPAAGAAELQGTVTSVDGWPLAGVTVTAVAGTGVQVGWAVTDDVGAYRLAVSGTGRVTLVVAAAGLEPRAVPVAVRAGRAALAPVTLVSSAAGDLPPAGRWVIDPAHSVVRATARHLGLSRVEGRFADFDGVIEIRYPLEQSAVEVSIATASIGTGNADRDRHLRSADFLDVERFPHMTYRSTAVAAASDGHWRIDGVLTIRDISRPVPLDMTYVGSEADPWGATRSAFVATAQLARRDYEMSWNLGLPGGLSLVGPTLRIDLDVQAVLDPQG
ncbi:YceI family protein [Nakamurella endophytica]|nr:YceI family protein [Nakamurella endophytica]